MLPIRGWRAKAVPDRWTAVIGGLTVLCGFLEPAIAAQPQDLAVETGTIGGQQIEPGIGDTILSPLDPGTLDEGSSRIDDAIEAAPGEAASDSGAEPPEVQYGFDILPAPVRRLREQIIDAALTGDIEKLRPVFEANDGPPAMSTEPLGDPVEELRSLSGDPEGHEILAILIEVLEAGYVHVDVGTPEEMYIWPYFARYPLTRLDGPQMVELFKLLTAGDYEDMKIYDIYLFYRVGIDPKGVWRYFLAGD
jgi:hypothetical protein